jgi:hypothetical protein
MNKSIDWPVKSHRYRAQCLHVRVAKKEIVLLVERREGLYERIEAALAGVTVPIDRIPTSQEFLEDCLIGMSYGLYHLRQLSKTDGIPPNIKVDTVELSRWPLRVVLDLTDHYVADVYYQDSNADCCAGSGNAHTEDCLHPGEVHLNQRLIDTGHAVKFEQSDKFEEDPV